MNREVATPNMYNIYYTKNFTMGPFYICSRQLDYYGENTTVTRKGSSIGTEPNYYRRVVILPSEKCCKYSNNCKIKLHFLGADQCPSCIHHIICRFTALSYS